MRQKRQAPNRRKLTDLGVSRLRPPASGQTIIWDVLVPAFGIRLSHTGRKTWIVAVRRPGKSHPVRLKLRPQPKSLAEARAKAREVMEHGAPATRPTFAKTVETFLEHGLTKKGRPLRQNTRDQYRRVLGRYATELSPRPINAITRPDVSALLGRVAAESGGPTASLARSMLMRLFGFAISTGDLGDRAINPVSGTPAYAVPKRSRVLSDAELRALWASTEAAEDYNLIIRIMLWTGCRRGEAGGMRWSELSGDRTVWTIPATRAKNHRELVLPLARQTVAALGRWHRFNGRDHLFGRTAACGFSNWGDAKERLDGALRFNAPWDVHDCRRTVETRMAKLGLPKEHVNRTLNHAVSPVTGSYDFHDYAPEKRAALQRWADELGRIAVI